jgi:tetratricopeptide (TPR) repeat protein
LADPVRRNDPCPCGSGKRYKECHGKLAAAGADDPDSLAQQALRAHSQGRIDEAERGYRAVLERAPGHALATHYLGLAAWQRGDRGAAEPLMRAALERDASVPDFHNNLGLLLRDTGRVGDAIAAFRRALDVDPRWLDAYSNLGLALEAAGRFDEAIGAYRAAIAARPQLAAARQNLARTLVAGGAWAEGWGEYRWRLVAQGLAADAPDPSATPLPASLAGRRFVLHAEQGLGDEVFFLRFAPELVRRGAQLAYRGDARLAGMLARTGLFALGVADKGTPAPASAPGQADPEAVMIGDLPWLTQAHDAARFPDALALRPLPERVDAVRAELERAGPRPWVALTWRGGVASAGPARTQVKEIVPERLGAALAGMPATWIGVQRVPHEGDYARLAAGLGAAAHDASSANDDLERMLALLSLCDAYVTVSNANVHLRAGVGGPMHVLVPHPPEWRWGLAGERSPWFRTATVHRQEVNGDWDAALTGLAAALAATLHRG